MNPGILPVIEIAVSDPWAVQVAVGCVDDGSDLHLDILLDLLKTYNGV